MNIIPSCMMKKLKSLIDGRNEVMCRKYFFMGMIAFNSHCADLSEIDCSVGASRVIGVTALFDRRNSKSGDLYSARHYKSVAHTVLTGKFLSVDDFKRYARLLDERGMKNEWLESGWSRYDDILCSMMCDPCTDRFDDETLECLDTLIEHKEKLVEKLDLFRQRVPLDYCKALFRYNIL